MKGTLDYMKYTDGVDFFQGKKMKELGIEFVFYQVSSA